jgi:hypothetical protein
MTRKDYVALAEVMKGEKIVPTDYASMSQWEKGASDSWNTTVLALAAMLARDNPRFDRARFLKACGAQSWTGTSAIAMTW